MNFFWGFLLGLIVGVLYMAYRGAGSAVGHAQQQRT